MSIWNIDIWQRKKYLIPAVSCYFMSLLDKVSYLLDSIMLLSQIIDTMISTVKFERNKLPFTIEDILKGEFNWNVYEITPPCYVMNICILYQLYFKQNDFLKEELIGYTRANFHHATTFGCRNIAFQIWWLPCNPHRSEWPKTFLGGVYASPGLKELNLRKLKHLKTVLPQQFDDTPQIEHLIENTPAFNKKLWNCVFIFPVKSHSFR